MNTTQRSAATNEEHRFLENYKGKEAHMKIHDYTFGLIVNTHFWENIRSKKYLECKHHV